MSLECSVSTSVQLLSQLSWSLSCCKNQSKSFGLLWALSPRLWSLQAYWHLWLLGLRLGFCCLTFLSLISSRASSEGAEFLSNAEETLALGSDRDWAKVILNSITCIVSVVSLTYVLRWPIQSLLTIYLKFALIRLRTIAKRNPDYKKDDLLESPQVYRHTLLGIFMVCSMIAGRDLVLSWVTCYFLFWC